MKKYLSLIILNIILAGSILAQPLLVFQTNSTNGYLYPCRCPKEPKGGLAKRQTLIKKLAVGYKDYLLLDSGDLLGLDSDAKSDSLVFAAYKAMGYDALAPGDQEFCRGVNNLLRLQKQYDLPFVAANLTYQGRPLFPAYKIVTSKALKIRAAVIGLMSPGAFKYYPQDSLQGLEIGQPEPALRSALDSLKNKADLFILVSHLGFDAEQELAGRFPELSLIIGGHTQNEIKEADITGGVPIIESGAGAKYLSRALLEKKNGTWRLGNSQLEGITSDLANDPTLVKIVGLPPQSQHNGTTVVLPGDTRLQIQAFVAPDCPDCQRLERGLFRRLTEEHEKELVIVYRHVDDAAEYQSLINYEKLLNDKNNQIPAVVIGNRILGGVEEIERDLERLVKEALARRSLEEQKPKSKATGAPLDKQGQRAEKKIETGTVDTIYLAFVSNSRCQKCSRAEYMLKALKAQYPNLSVNKIEISSDSSKLLAEALGLLYHVPESQRIIAPSAFVGQDYLTGDDVNDIELSKLIEKYKNGSGIIPWLEARNNLFQARQSMLERFRSFGLWGVIGAGLLDGINPCSLAVLVFFISYLAFVGRKRWEILAVGLAYTFADFLVYFLIGVGGLSFLMTLKALPVVSKIFYWLAIIAGLVLAFYNLKDYFKARRGDFSGMDLQLSTQAKQRIHKVIRDKMGAGGLIGGAFGVGLVTSVLEFACTGQVYLPTIAFVTQISTYRTQAYGYLLLYNLMFEVPMIITFIIAFWGVSSKRIAGWAQASVAGVKLLTALLFLLMSAALLYILIR
jgi:cytochrome c biogenesis protein CcdA/glutaredoxin